MQPIQYAPHRVQEPSFTGLYSWPWQLIAHASSAYQFWNSYAFLLGRYNTLSVSAVTDLHIWSFGLETGAHHCSWHDQPIYHLVFLGLIVLDLWANTCQTHHVTSRPRLFTLVMMVVLGDTGLRTPCVYQVWSSYPFSFGRHNAFPVSALIDLVTLTSDLETGAHYCPWAGQPS